VRVKVRNAGVETWMKNIETSMKQIVQKKIKEAYAVYYNFDRKEWVLNHIG
jgi:hypothetical protein